jgi:hypothetical protein
MHNDIKMETLAVCLISMIWHLEVQLQGDEVVRTNTQEKLNI